MSLSRIRDLQTAWFGTHTNPTPFAKKLDSAFDRIGFTEGYVARTVAESGQRSHRSKVVKDNVWGMIELDDSCIRLIDCPVVQRLRGVKQLGFSYLTYPSAEHSRFIHSLGMAGVVSRFMDAASRPPREGNPLFQSHQIPSSDRADLTHAAMLHDSGHLPFSHASEFALQVLTDTVIGGIKLNDFMFEAEKQGLVRNPKLAELLSVALVLSRRFGSYYVKHVRSGDTSDGVADSPLRIASYVLGQPTSSKNVGYAELISGRAIDADKLDYVSRDALACGIPTGIDVGRLFLRSGFLQVEQAELNRLQLRAGHKLAGENQVHFIVNSAGRDTIEELISARTSLYHRVYFHQTTRNAERLYEKLIEEASRSTLHKQSLDCLDVWAASDEHFISTLLDSDDVTVATLASRLHGRQLPKRAAIFGQGELSSLFPLRTVFPTGSFFYDEAPIKLLNLQKFSKHRLCGADLSSLEGEIADECKKLLDLVRADLAPDSLLAKAVEAPLVLISPAQFSPAVHDDCLVLQNRELVYSKEIHNVTQTNDAEEVFQAAGYVLTDEPWRELTLLAARKLLVEKTQDWTHIEVRVEGQKVFEEPTTILLGQSAGEASNPAPGILTTRAFTSLFLDQEKLVGRTSINRQKLEEIQDHASRRGYFDSFPFLARKPELRWEELKGKFARFEGQYRWKISKELAEAYVWQFPPTLRQSCISMLHSLEVLDQREAAKLVAVSVESLHSQRHPTKAKIRIAPLSPNSGNEVRIALEEGFRGVDAFRKRNDVFHSLEGLLQAEANSVSPIALVDDNLVSGSQAFCQLASWMGIQRAKWPEDLRSEQNIDPTPLTPASRAKFFDLMVSGLVGICVAYGSTTQWMRRFKTFAELVEAENKELSDSSNRETSPADLKQLSVESGRLFAETDTPFEIPIYVGRSIEAVGGNVLADKDFVGFLQIIGADLYAQAKFGQLLGALKPEQKNECAENALGYGNARGLTITFRNSPVSTLTPLWCPGEFRGRPWIPLAIRRGYCQRLLVG